jgi:hypothetical protein
MRISYATRSPNPSGARQNSFIKSVQGEAADEYRRALLAPLSSAPYGSRAASPKLVSLSKHVQQGENKVAETTIALTFGALSLGVGIEQVCRPFRVIEGMLRAQVPTPNYSLEELQQMETTIEGECNNLQMEYMRGDKSQKVKRDMLERFERIYAVIGQIIAQLRKDLYGGPQR